MLTLQTPFIDSSYLQDKIQSLYNGMYIKTTSKEVFFRVGSGIPGHTWMGSESHGSLTTYYNLLFPSVYTLTLVQEVYDEIELPQTQCYVISVHISITP